MQNNFTEQAIIIHNYSSLRPIPYTCFSAVNYVKECDGTHSEYCARRVPTLRKQRNTQNGVTLAVTQPYGYRVVPYRVGTTAHIRSIDTFFNVEVRANLNLSAVNYVPYTQDIRNIYVRYTQDNRVVNLITPYLLPAFYLFLSAFFLETTPISFRYHLLTIQYFPRTLQLFFIFFPLPLAQITKKQ